MQMRVLEYSCSDGNRKNSIVEIVPRFPLPLFIVFSLRCFFFSFSPPDFSPPFPLVFNNTTSRGRKPRTVLIARIMSRAALSLSLFLSLWILGRATEGKRTLAEEEAEEKESEEEGKSGATDADREELKFLPTNTRRFNNNLYYFNDLRRCSSSPLPFPARPTFSLHAAATKRWIQLEFSAR